MNMKECPSLRNVVQESTGGARTHGATKKTDQRVIVIPQYKTHGGKLHGRRERKSQSVVELTGTE